MSTKAEQLEKAAGLGRAAFAAGVASAPAHDPAVLAMLSGRRVGETPEGEASTVEILKAWSQAWHRANIGAPLFTAADVVSVCTRAQLIEDGQLIDVSELAREAGFKVPVALTAAAWADCVAWADDDNKRKRTCQDETGRLWDVLWMGFLSAWAASGNNNVRRFELYRVPREGGGRKPRRVALLLRIGPGDNLEPVITITTETED